MVLADGGQELVVNWTQSRWGADDLEKRHRQCDRLPSRSPLRPRAEPRWSASTRARRQRGVPPERRRKPGRKLVATLRQLVCASGVAEESGSPNLPRRPGSAEGEHNGAVPAPAHSDSRVPVESRYGNFIGGEWVPPVTGEYFENITPVTGQLFTEIARSTGDDSSSR